MKIIAKKKAIIDFLREYAMTLPLSIPPVNGIISPNPKSTTDDAEETLKQRQDAKHDAPERVSAGAGGGGGEIEKAPEEQKEEQKSLIKVSRRKFKE